MQPIIVLQDIRGCRNPCDDKLYTTQGGACFYCEQYMLPEKQTVQGFTYDHLFPAYLGFTLQGNKVLACSACNHRKDSRMPTVVEIIKAARLYVAHGRKLIAKVRIY